MKEEFTIDHAIPLIIILSDWAKIDGRETDPL